jgi:hypothetical protein
MSPCIARRTGIEVLCVVRRLEVANVFGGNVIFQKGFSRTKMNSGSSYYSTPCVVLRNTSRFWTCLNVEVPVTPSAITMYEVKRTRFSSLYGRSLDTEGDGRANCEMYKRKLPS